MQVKIVDVIYFSKRFAEIDRNYFLHTSIIKRNVDKYISNEETKNDA